LEISALVFGVAEPIIPPDLREKPRKAGEFQR
jgi:hypothetical protein